MAANLIYYLAVGAAATHAACEVPRAIQLVRQASCLFPKGCTCASLGSRAEIIWRLGSIAPEDRDFVVQQVRCHILADPSCPNTAKVLACFQKIIKNNQRDPKQTAQIALYYAAKGDDVPEAIANWAIDAGADLNQLERSPWRNTPLVWAIANAQQGKTRYLIRKMKERNCGFDTRCEFGNTALHILVGKGYRSKSESGEPFDCFPIVRDMLEAGAYVNVTDEERNTPLHLAALRRDYDLCKLLIEHGASEDVRNNQGKTPQDLLECSHGEACAFLERRVVVYSLDSSAFFDAGNLSKIQALFA